MPLQKMATRVAASLNYAAGIGELVCKDLQVLFGPLSFFSWFSLFFRGGGKRNEALNLNWIFFFGCTGIQENSN